MSVLAKNKRQLIFIYSESSRLSKRVLPHVLAMDKEVQRININEESISNTVWTEIASMLDVSLNDLFDSEELPKSDYESKKEFSDNDWLKIIDNHPSALRHPIAINGDRAEQIHEKHQIFTFFNPTGANFDKSPEAIKHANHKDTTEYKDDL